MSLIKLTGLGSGKPVYLNAKQIVAIYAQKENTALHTTAGDDPIYVVTEPLDVVLKAVAEVLDAQSI